MKKLRLFLCVIAAVCLLAGTAEALDAKSVESAVPESAREILGSAGADDGAESLFKRIWSAASEELTGAVRAALKNGGAVLAAAVACSVAGAVNGAGKTPDFAALAGVLAIAAVSAGSVSSFLSAAAETLSELDSFSKALLPTLAASGAATGAAVSASAKYLASSLFIDVLITASGRVVMPLIGAFLAASVADAAVGGGALRGAAGLIKWLAVTVMTLITLAFVIYISVTGIVTSTLDAATMRAARTAVSAALPVVGGMISDAAGVVINGAAALRGAVGVFGLIVVCAVCVTPFLRLAAQLIVFKAAAALAAPVADARISRLLSDIGTAFGMTLGLVGSAAVMLFVSVISAMKLVTG